MVVGVQTQQRRATAAVWSASGKVLAAGELGVATDTKIIKIGDGVNEWDDLPVAYSNYYLSIGGTAADSNLLGGISSAGFVKTVDATTAATPDKVAKRLSDGRLKAAAGVSTDDVANVTQMAAAVVDAQKRAVSRIETASFTLALTDAGKLVLANNNAYSPTIVCTVPNNTAVAFPIGSTIDLMTADKGPVSITPASGVTVYGQSLLYGGASSLQLVKTDTNGWLVVRVSQSPGPILRRKIRADSNNNMVSSAFTKLRLDGADSGTAFFTNNLDTLGSNEQYNSGTELYRCYVRRSGYYRVVSQLTMSQVAAGRFFVQVRVNNIEQHAGSGSPRANLGEITTNYAATLPLNVGDFIEVWGYQDGGATNFPAEAAYAPSFFEWTWQRPL